MLQLDRRCTSEIAASRKDKVKHVNGFIPTQAADIALRTGNAPTVDKLARLSKNAATDKNDSAILRGEKGAQLLTMQPHSCSIVPW